MMMTRRVYIITIKSAKKVVWRSVQSGHRFQNRSQSQPPHRHQIRQVRSPIHSRSRGRKNLAVIRMSQVNPCCPFLHHGLTVPRRVHLESPTTRKD